MVLLAWYDAFVVAWSALGRVRLLVYRNILITDHIQQVRKRCTFFGFFLRTLLLARRFLLLRLLGCKRVFLVDYCLDAGQVGRPRGHREVRTAHHGHTRDA